jgi:transposase
VIKAKVPKAVIAGSFASAEAIAHLAAQKFVMDLPLYRQEKELAAKGITLSRKTMSNWLMKASEQYLFPLYERLKVDLLQNEIPHADETTLQVLNEPEKKAQSKSFMWLYRTGNTCV